MQDIVALYRQGRDHEADQLVLARPGDADALHLGALLSLRAGRLEQAWERVSQSLELSSQAPYHNTAGLVCWARNHLDDAGAFFCKALELDSSQPEYHYNLGWLSLYRQKVSEARQHLENALKRRPDYPEAAIKLAATYALRGQLDHAIAVSRGATRLAKGVELRAFWLRLASRPQEALEQVLEVEHEPGPLLDTVGAYPAAWKDPRVVARLYELADQFEASRLQGSILDFLRPRLISEPDSLWHDPLFKAVLRRGLVVKADYEQWLCDTRRQWLLATPPEDEERLVTLALQCWNNEYLFDVTEEEQEAFLKLPIDSILRACYDPKARPRHPQLHQRLVEWPERESLLRPKLESKLSNETSRAVQSQYEENPYPRYLQPYTRDGGRPHAVLLALFPHATPPPIHSSNYPVLIAGCGTGQHIFITARRFSGSKILAVDLSAASLAYAARQLETAGLEVELLQADLLSLRDLKRTFPLIECVGVLHHLKNPAEGLQVLKDLLEPGGFIKIGIYSRRARQGIMAAQQLAKEQGFQATPPSMRAFRRYLRSLPASHPARRGAEVGDFFTLSMCRDLLFHVQEHSYNLAEVRALVEGAGLEFVGFESLPAEALACYRALFPDDETMTNWTYWDKFEEIYPHTFLSLYQVWCRLP